MLLIDKGDGPVLYRGTNMEVSMPTGSLCAERNVIGTALATNPGLKREDLKMVAVLAIQLSDENLSYSTSRRPNLPPGASTDICTNIESDFRIVEKSDSSLKAQKNFLKHQRPENMRRSLSIGSFASIVECDDNEDDEILWCSEKIRGDQFLSKKEDISILSDNNSSMGNEAGAVSINQDVGNPIRKIKLYPESGSAKQRKMYTSSGRKKNRAVLVHSVKVSSI